MNETLRMQVSAFVDGELPDNEAELLLRRLSQDAELRQLVGEYLEIGRYLRREAELPNMGQLRGRIAEALGEDTAVSTTVEQPMSNRFLKPLAGVAVAASVTMLAIFTLQQSGPPQTDGQPVAEADAYTEPSADQQLDELFLRHYENSSAGAGNGGILDLDLDRVDLSEAGLVEVAPRAALLGSMEITSDVEEDEADDDDPKGDDSEESRVD